MPGKKNQLQLFPEQENVDFRVFGFVMEKFLERGLKPALQFQDGFLAVSFFKLPAGIPVEAS
jgi:hypothetical protein